VHGGPHPAAGVEEKALLSCSDSNEFVSSAVGTASGVPLVSNQCPKLIRRGCLVKRTDPFAAFTPLEGSESALLGPTMRLVALCKGELTETGTSKKGSGARMREKTAIETVIEAGCEFRDDLNATVGLAEDFLYGLSLQFSLGSIGLDHPLDSARRAGQA
jgi:hypothetical protein